MTVELVLSTDRSQYQFCADTEKGGPYHGGIARYRTSSLYYIGLASQLYYSEVEFLQKDYTRGMDHTRLVNNEARSRAYALVQFWSECERCAEHRLSNKRSTRYKRTCGFGQCALTREIRTSNCLRTAMITAVLARQCQIA